MDKYYTLKVAGLERQLLRCPISDTKDIAGFIMFSDVELTVACATELLKLCPEFDILITAESKGIPLAYEMSRQCGKTYLLARKSIKLYMKNPIGVDVKSITTSNMQRLYLDSRDVDLLKGKRVLVVDDVISTGDSIHALETLVETAGGTVVGRAAVLAEGEAADRKDLVFLAPLPILDRED